MGDIRHSIGALFVLAGILSGIVNTLDILTVTLVFCGIILLLYPYNSGSNIKHVEREETRSE